jgi:hypothetical protein
MAMPSSNLFMTAASRKYPKTAWMIRMGLFGRPMWKISLGPHLFDYGYGPFRWVCLSGKDEDLELTDAMAMKCIDPNRRYQDKDNYDWIKECQNQSLGRWYQSPHPISRCLRTIEDCS